MKSTKKENFTESSLRHFKTQVRESFEGLRAQFKKITGMSMEEARSKSMKNLSEEQKRVLDRRVRVFLERSDNFYRSSAKPLKMPSPSKKVRIPL